MSGRDDVPYPIVYEDHDGSWAWSVESGKAYEPGHVIHARGDGCITRREARKAADAALACVATGPGPPTAASEASLAAGMSGWAIVADRAVVAVFAGKAAAKQFAETTGAGTIRPVRCRFDWK